MALVEMIVIIDLAANDTYGNTIQYKKTYNLKVDDATFATAALQVDAVRSWVNNNIAKYTYNSNSGDIRTNAGITGVSIGFVHEAVDYSFLNNFDAGLLPAGQNAKEVSRNHIQFYECDNKKKIRFTSPEPVNSIENQDIIINENNCVFTLFSGLVSGVYLCSNKYNNIIKFLRSEFIANE